MYTQPMKLLIIEDNHTLAENLANFFALYPNIELDFAYDGEQGLALALEHYYDCVILDINLPKRDGYSVCQALRAQAQRYIPIIMLTARDALNDKINGFSLGADDYLTKPFALEELYVRCLALAKRHLLNTSHTLNLGTGDVALSLNTQSQQVSRAGVTLSLQPIAFKILQILMENHPRAISRSELCERIWGEHSTESDALRSHLYQLRKALDKPFETAIIKTIHGIGVSLDIPAE